MNNTNKNMVEDLRKLLNNYLTVSDGNDLIKKVLDSDFTVQNILGNNIVDLDKDQLKYELPKGIDYRIITDKIITHTEKLLPGKKFYNLMLDISQLMIFNGELSYALEISEELLNKLPAEEKDSNISAETNLMISKIYWSQAHWDDCNSYISRARKIFKSVNNKCGLAKCENMLGTMYGEKGDFIRAKKHFEAALLYLNVKDDLSLRAMTFTNLGIISTINKDYEKAIWNHKNASEIFLTLKDQRRLSRVYHNIGMLYTKMEDYDTALDEFNKCISISIKNDYLSNCAVAYIGKAYIYTKLNNPVLADAYTEKAMEIAYKLNDTLSIADIYKIKGMIQNDMQNFELSEEMFENSIRLNKDIESKLNEAESADQLGRLLEKNNRAEEAKAYLRTSANYFSQLKQEKTTAGLVELSI